MKGINTMALNFANIKLEVIDITTNATPDIYINQNCITISKRVLEDLNYPQNVQYCIDSESKVFAIRPCKSNEVKAMPFSKPKAEQINTLSISSKNLLEVLRSLITDYDAKKRYRVVGQYDPESKVMYYEMVAAEVSIYRANKEDAED